MESVPYLDLTPATHSEAPALSRGLALIGLLEREAPLSLDGLATHLSLPKASLLRLLGTLLDVGLIRKNPDRTYEALWALRPLHDPRSLFRERVAAALPALAEATGCTAEWYELREGGLELVLQTHPDRELRIQAQPGFLRAWRPELEAVACLGYAFAPAAPPPTGLKRYFDDGVFRKISIRVTAALVEESRREGLASDSSFNSHGIRRHAIAACVPEKGGLFLGVMAVAEAFRFDARPRANDFLKPLTRTLQRLRPSP